MKKREIEALAGILFAVGIGSRCSNVDALIPFSANPLATLENSTNSVASFPKSYSNFSLENAVSSSVILEPRSLSDSIAPSINDSVLHEKSYEPVSVYEPEENCQKDLTELTYFEKGQLKIIGYISSKPNFLESKINETPYFNTIYRDKESKIKLGEVITVLPEQLEVIYSPGKSLKETNQDGINGGYFCLSDPRQVGGILFMDGCNKANVLVKQGTPLARTVFALKGKINSEGSYSFLADILPNVRDLKDLIPRCKTDANNFEYSYNYLLGAGPNLFPEIQPGQEFFSLEKLILANPENFPEDILFSNRAKSAVGITSEGLVKLVGVYSKNLYLWELSNLMKSLGCVKAMNLDGGGSSQMSFNKKIFLFEPLKSGEGARKLSTFIVIKEE